MVEAVEPQEPLILLMVMQEVLAAEGLELEIQQEQVEMETLRTLPQAKVIMEVLGHLQHQAQIMVVAVEVVLEP
jgi:hypothetical protein